MLFYKIYNKQAPGYLTELIPTRNEAYQTRHFADIPSLSSKHNFFKNVFPINYPRMEQTRSLPLKFS